jgi:hypothetical protein
MSDVALLAVGAYGPLEGFMGEADYRGVLRDMRLANGLPWMVPITLAVRKAAADALREGREIALVTPWEEPIAILHVEKRFPYDGREEARRVYGTDDARHPGAAYQLNRGGVLLAGKVDLIARPPLRGFEPYRLGPAAARARFRELDWRTVVGFQTQQPMHRAHEYITYFRWWGVYTQGDGIRAVGGKGGEGKAVPYFMVRIRIRNGQLFSHQLRVIAGFAERSARGVADITVLENIQLHWMPVEVMPDLIESLWRVGSRPSRISPCPSTRSSMRQRCCRSSAGSPRSFSRATSFATTARRRG